MMFTSYLRRTLVKDLSKWECALFNLRKIKLARPGIELTLVGHGAKGEPNGKLNEKTKPLIINRKRHEGLT